MYEVRRLKPTICEIFMKMSKNILAVVTSTLLTIVRTEITLVSYFSTVTSFMTSLTLVRNFRLDDPVQWKRSQERRQRG